MRCDALFCTVKLCEDPRTACTAAEFQVYEWHACAVPTGAQTGEGGCDTATVEFQVLQAVSGPSGGSLTLPAAFLVGGNRYPSEVF